LLTADHHALRIAAVIPTRDRAALTVRAVESALAQTRPPDEVIVIDDGSLDDTRDRMAAFGDAVRCISRAPGGASSARNRGVLEASAGWIAFLDSDDVWRPQHLERMDAAIASTSGAAGMYFADVEFEGDARSSWERSAFAVGPRYELRCDASWVMLPRQPMMTPAVVVDRERYLSCGGQAEQLGCREDTHLFFKLGLSHPLCAVAGVGAHVMADAGDDRLSADQVASARRFWDCTVWLYSDLLERSPHLAAHHRAELRRRLAVAHWRLARISWSERRPASLTANAVRSLTVDHRVAMDRTLARGRG